MESSGSSPRSSISRTKALKTFEAAEKLLRSNQNARAAELFELAAESAPGEPSYRAYAIWSSFLADQKTSEEARSGLLELVQATPELVVGYVFLGRLVKLEGNEADAIRFFKKALSHDAKNVDALREVRLYNMRKDGTEEKGREGKSFFGRLFSKDK